MLSIIIMFNRFSRNFQWKGPSYEWRFLGKGERQGYSLLGSGIRPFKWDKKSSTLDDFEGQYSNGNCLGCSAFSLAIAGLLVVYRALTMLQRLTDCTTWQVSECSKNGQTLWHIPVRIAAKHWDTWSDAALRTSMDITNRYHLRSD